MNFLERMRTASDSMLSPRYEPDGIGGRGLMGFAVDKAERYGASFAFGAAKGYYREKAVWKGVGAELWIGGALTLAGAALNIFSDGRSALAPHAERVGDAGVMGYLNSIGTGWGMEKAGRTVQVLEGGKVLPRLPLPAGVYGDDVPAQVLGDIPVATGGDYLTADEMARYSGPRQ